MLHKVSQKIYITIPDNIPYFMQSFSLIKSETETDYNVI